MPNKKGGKKYKKGKSFQSTNRNLVLKENDSEELGQIIAVKGSGRFDVECCDGVTRLGIVRGALRKRLWINLHDMVLTSLWEFEDKKCSIIHKYDENEISKLRKLNQIPKNYRLKSEDQYETFHEDIVDSDDEVKREIPDSESESDSELDDIDLDEI